MEADGYTLVDQSGSVSVNQGTIAVDAFKVESEAGVRPIPSMFYDSAFVELKFKGLSISFRSVESLACSKFDLGKTMNVSDLLAVNPKSCIDCTVRREYLGQILVRYSAQWQASRSLENIPVLQYDHDWTFTTTYWGSIWLDKGIWVEPPKDSIGETCVTDFFPMSLLTDTTLPVRFFREITFWEDELDDNGYSRCTCRVRVMDVFVYVLLKFELRVDGVIGSRSLESRILYHLKDKMLLREFKWIENGVEQKQLTVQQTFSTLV